MLFSNKMCTLTSFVGAHAGRHQQIRYKALVHPAKRYSPELFAFANVLSTLYPRWIDALFIDEVRPQPAPQVQVIGIAPELAEDEDEPPRHLTWRDASRYVIKTYHDAKEIKSELSIRLFQVRPDGPSWKSEFKVVDMRWATRNQVWLYTRYQLRDGTVTWVVERIRVWGYEQLWMPYPRECAAFVSRGRGATASAVEAGVWALGRVWTLDSVD